MSLTGGLDTRMIMAWQKPNRGLFHATPSGVCSASVRTLSWGVGGPYCGQPHQVIRTGEEFFARFPHYAERAVYLTDGCVDVSRAPDLYLNERAREIAPVRMTGNYGGEVLRRVRAFKAEEPSPVCFLQISLLYSSGKGDVCGARSRASSFIRGFQAGSLASLWGSGAGGDATLHAIPLSRQRFCPNGLSRAGIALRDERVSMRLIADGNAALLRIPTDRGLAGERGRFFSGGLPRSSRVPVQSRVRLRHGNAPVDGPLGSCSFAFAPRTPLPREAQIFHFRIWYRDALAEYVQEMLLDPRSLSRPYVERKGLEAVVRGHLKGDRNYTTEIHKVLTLELLHRLLLDNPERGGLGERPGVPVAVSADQ